VINGYVSMRSAREDYGVVIKEPEMQVDQEATQKLRDDMKVSQGG